MQGFRQPEACRKAESELILILRREGVVKLPSSYRQYFIVGLYPHCRKLIIWGISLAHQHQLRLVGSANAINPPTRPTADLSFPLWCTSNSPILLAQSREDPARESSALMASQHHEPSS